MTPLTQGDHPDREAALEVIRVTVVVLDPGEWWSRGVIHPPHGSRETRVHGSAALKSALLKVSSAAVAVVPPGSESVVSNVEPQFPRIATCRTAEGGGSARESERLARAVVRARRMSPAGLVVLDPAWPDEVSWAASRFLTLCLSDDLDGVDVTDCARRLATSLRTLERDCEEGGLQTPRRVLALARAFRMAWPAPGPGAHTGVRGGRCGALGRCRGRTRSAS